MSQLVVRFQTIVQRIQQVSQGRAVCLIAISKTKPVNDIAELYQAGHRDFGENYAEELEKKSTDSLIREQCPEIRWHFVGHLQRKKVTKFLNRVQNLECIQTVDSIELAERLNSHLQSQARKLNILLQINTSNEKQKYGIQPDEFVKLYEHIRSKCLSLNCQGLMTIGSISNVQTESDEDFRILLQCRDKLVQQFQQRPEQIELSMGMSHDYERAIQSGSSIIRVGSSIFGARK